MMWFRWSLGLLALLSLTVHPGGPSAAAAEAPADQALLRLRDLYRAVDDLTAKFTQTSYLVASGMEREMAGNLALKKGGRVRWNYLGDDPQEIVSDGVTLWFYQVRDRTVLRQNLDALPAANRIALDLLGGFENVESHFRVESCGDACVQLLPRVERPDLARVRLELAADGAGVRSVTTEDALGNRNRVEFHDLKTNTGIGDGRFRFEVPEGVQVLEMEAAGR